MTRHFIAWAGPRPRAVATLATTAAMAITAMTAPPAYAATPPMAAPSALSAPSAPSTPSAQSAQSAPPTLPTQVTAAIAKVGLSVQTNEGWEAVTGSAGCVNWVRALATVLGVGSLGEYTVDGEAGQAILIFSGNDDSSVGFSIDGAAADSAANETSKTWTVSAASDLPDATLRPGTAEDITPVSNSWGPDGTVVRAYVSFLFS